MKNLMVKKPWGEEYIICKTNKSATWHLKINTRKKTSLHSHPNKKTGFLILKGTAEVQVGIYKKNIKKYKPLSILVLRPGLFHKIKASNNTVSHDSSSKKFKTFLALEGVVQTPFER